MTDKKTPLAKYCTENSMIQTKKPSGNRVGLESEVFDQVFNILISIRRSLNNVCELPGQDLTEWQFKKKVTFKNDWLAQGG